MSGAGFEPPIATAGHHVAFMIYKPHWSAQRGLWVPGAYLHEMGSMVCTWDDFVARIERPPLVVAEKGRIPSISPGVLTRGSEKREAKNVERVWALAIDLDHGQDDLDHVLRRCIELELPAIAHTTWSHMHPGKGPRWRVWVRIEEPIEAKDWPRYWRAAMTLLCGGVDARMRADRSCINADRVYYSPAVAPGWEHTYQTWKTPYTSPLLTDDVWTAAGVVATNPTSAPASERVAAIATHRSMLAPMARRITPDDLAALAKDKKRCPDPAMRAAFKAASKGERMLVVKGESRGAVLTEARAAGLFEGDVDPFLTALMYRLAIAHRNADPLEIDRVFSGSMGVLIDDDLAAGNRPYETTALGRKFSTAVVKVDEDEVSKAEKLGVPTRAEFQAAHGSGDIGRIDGELPGRIWQGNNCFFIWRRGENGDLEAQPISNFGIIPREIWQSEDVDENGARALKYVVDLVGDDVAYTEVELPAGALTSTRELNAFLTPYHPLVWKASSDDQTRDVKLRIEEYAQKNGNLKRYISTHKLGTRIDGTVVAPQLTFRAPTNGAIGIEEVTDGVRFERSKSFTWNRGVYDSLAPRSLDLDLNVMKRFAALAPTLNDPRVMWPTIGWFAASVIRPMILAAQNSFPHLQIVGSQGSGKSFLGAKFAVDAFGGFEVSIQNMPFYSAARECAGTLSFSVMLEEFRDDGKYAHRVREARSLLRSDYNDTRIPRAGFADLIVQAPIVITGEQRIFGEGSDFDRAVAERMVMVRPKLTYTSIAKAADAEAAARYKAAFDELNALPIEASGMWAAFPAWVAARWSDVDVVRAWLQRAHEYIEPAIKSWPRSVAARVYENLRVVWFGLWIWQAWCEALGVAVELPSVDVVCRSTLEEITGVAIDSQPDPITGVVPKQDGFDQIGMLLEEVSILLSSQGLTASLSTSPFWLREGNDLWLDVPGMLTFYKRMSAETIVASSRQVFQYAEESDFAIKKPGVEGREAIEYRKHIPGSQRQYSRCVRLSIPALENAGVSLATMFLTESSSSPKMKAVG